MNEAAFVGELAHDRSSIASSRVSIGNRVLPVVLELLVIGGAAAVLITIVSMMLASRDLFLGYFGDQQQFLWHADNLKQVLRGDPMITRAFFGEPEPYAYHHIALFVGLPTLVMAELSGNPVFTANFMLLAFLALNFCAMYAVLRLLHFGVLISAVFATAFLCAPVTLTHALGHLSLIVTFLLPLYLYVIYLIKQRPQSLTLWLACGLIAGSYVWVREELGLFAVAAAAMFLVVNARAVVERRLALHVGIWVVTVALFALPILALYMHRWDFDREHGIQTIRDTQQAQQYSASPANYLFPSDESFLYGQLPIAFEHTEFVERLNYLGIVNLVGVGAWLYMVVFRRDLLEGLLRGAPFLRMLKWELALLATFAMIVSFGPILELNGSTLNLPLKLGYDADSPVIEQMRSWARFGIFAFVPISILSAHVARFLLTRQNSPAVLALLTVPALILIVVDQYPVGSLVRHKLEVPAAVREIEEAEGDPFVLHVPMDQYSGAIHNSTALFFQLYHDKRIVNGYAPFVHPLFDRRVLSSPLVCFHYPQMLTVKDNPECSTPVIARFLVDEDIRFIIYEKVTWGYFEGFGLDEDTALRERSSAILNQLVAMGELERFYDDDSYTVYRLTSQPPSVSSSAWP